MFQFRSRHNFRSIVTALVIGSGLAATSAASAETVLSYSPWLPPGYVLNDAVIYPWMEKVEEVTEGRVRVESRAAAVGTAAQQYDAVRDGLVDISIISLGYTVGRFPMLAIGELPLLHEDDAVLAPTFYRLYEEYLAQHQPFRGVHLLSTYTSTPTHIVTTTGIIEDMSDLEGLKLRVPNSTAGEVANLIGAVPLQKPITEMYELVSGGIVDGTFFAPHSVVDFNLSDYLQYMTLVPGGVGQSVQMLLVNENKWNSISEEDRAAIMEISGEMLARAAGKAFADSEIGATQTMLEKGVTIEEMGPELFAEFSDALKPIDEAWIAKAEAAGLENAEEVLATFRAELVEEAKAQGGQ